jgi:uncharacterized protein YjbI with pentapeptide repeats
MSDTPTTKQILEAIASGQRPRSDIPSSLVGALLADAQLANLDLSGLDLSNADLSGADLSGAKLFRAKLVNAHLTGAKLERTELSGADLSGADLTGAHAPFAGLGQAKLAKAVLFETHLEHATLSLADLRSADLRCATLRDARLREAQLDGADLTEADLRAADLSRASVVGATFNNTDLRNGRLRLLGGYDSASWIGADVRNVNFAGAYLMRRFVADQNYLKEFRDRSKLSKIVYYIWLITSDCGRSMSRWLLLIALQVLLFAWLYTLVGIDYGKHETWLSPLYFSVVTLTSLGFGDIIPASTGGQILAMAEVLMGYLMLGGLISIFSNRVARRAD